MNTLWYNDGTDRQRWEKRRDIPCRMSMLESDYQVLMERILDMASGVRYFNLKNKPEGYWQELFRYQPLVVLNEIGRMDVRQQEHDFLKQGRRKPEMAVRIISEIAGKLDDWELRMVYYPRLQLAQDLVSRMKFQVPEITEEPRQVKKLFYGFLETVRTLQANEARYLQEIRSCGGNDPALALLDTFLRHYGEVITRFNNRWAEWPAFYFKNILHARCHKIVPDRTWLTFSRIPGSGKVVIPRDTAFVAGKNSNGKPIYYRSSEEIKVEDIQLVQVRSFFLERSPESFPAARLGFVTAISENHLDPETLEQSQYLFGETVEACLKTGMMLVSPMFLLEEGKRVLTVSFFLTEDSCLYFRHLLERIGGGTAGKTEETAGKLLKDAFLLSLTTGNGWEEIPEYTAVFEEGSRITLKFCLNRDFASTTAADPERHGWGSEWPVLRILINAKAWLFAYSWMIMLKCGRVKIRAEVKGLSALKVYSNIGELDVSAPFYPFGVQPERGAQLIFGNYEMALKPLRLVKLICKWLQLPAGPEGLYGHYRGYNRDIDNCSFQVRTEWLGNKKWKAAGSGFQPLFTPADGKSVEATGELPESSCLTWRLEEVSPVNIREERYEYGMTSAGFFRVVLEQPDMGFGHLLYQQLFAEVMMANARRRRPLLPPSPPVSPLIENLEVGYEAEEELYFTAGRRQGSTRLFYMDPMDHTVALPIAADKPFELAQDLGQTGNLLLGFRQVAGYDRIRFFVDIAAIQQEIDLRDQNALVDLPVWGVKQGDSWVELKPDALLRDTTGGFINSGLIDLLLPCRVPEDWLDRDGVLWLCVRFRSGFVRKVSVNGFYMNVGEVVLDVDTVAEDTEWNGVAAPETITAAVKKIPGVAAIRQIVAGRDGRKQEDEAALRGRIVHRIRHRNRAVTPLDYEDMVLEHFPQVAKVKCLPGLDSKDLARRGIVTLVVIPCLEEKTALPLCTHDLLLDIERYLQPLASASVQIDAINPLYEEMTVRCALRIEPGQSGGETVLRLRQRMNELIAPWRTKRELPVFGYQFALQELRNRIMEDEGVAALQGLSVLQVCRQGERLYRMNELEAPVNTIDKIGASCAWGIPVPAVNHLIHTDSGWIADSGIGEIEIGKTLVVK